MHRSFYAISWFVLAFTVYFTIFFAFPWGVFSSLPLLNRKNLNNWTVCYEVQNFRLSKGSKNIVSCPSETEILFPCLTERAKSKDIAHGAIIQVSTIAECQG